MKKLATLILGLSVLLGSAALTWAADEKKDTKPPAADTKTKKKHPRKKKNGAAPKPAATPTAPAPAK